MLPVMQEQPPQSSSGQKAGLAAIWIALLLALIVIAALSANTAQAYAEMERWKATGVYPTELTIWTRLRLSLATFWGRFWYLFAPLILCFFPGSVALYKLLRFARSK